MTRYRNAGVGLVFIVVLALIAYLVVLIFNQDLTPTRTLKLKADRAGLMMDPGAGVQLRGVRIGRVTAVRADGDGAELTLAIDPDKLHLIPQDVRADIVPPTAFGAKYVALDPPATTAAPIAAGATIPSARVTVEINQAFQHLMQTLQAARPADVNAALNAVAAALDGRGAQLGDLISDLDSYLKRLNPSMPELAADISTSTGVLRTYAAIAPDLVRIAANATVTSRTLTTQQKTLDALLVSFGSTADKTRRLLSDNGPSLAEAVNLMDPIAGLLARYSPEIPCTIEGLAYSNAAFDKAMGGAQGGIATTTELYPSQLPYKYPDDLPKIAADNPPGCYGLPVVPKSQALDPHIVADTGSNPYTHATTRTVPGLANTLFGVLMGLPGL